MHREINSHQNRALMISAVNVVPLVSHLLQWEWNFNQIQLCKVLALPVQREKKFTAFKVLCT